MDRSPALLAVVSSGCLPEIVHEGEHDGFVPDFLDDARNSCGLLTRTWASLSVASTSRRPSGLEVDARLARAEGIDDSELRSGELTSGCSIDVSVEEGVDVAAYNVDSATEVGGVCLPDIEGLGGGAWTGVASRGEGRLDAGDEGRELAGGAVACEDGLVSDDDELNEGELTPADNIGNLLGGTRDTGAGDEDTEDDFQT